MPPRARWTTCPSGGLAGFIVRQGAGYPRIVHEVPWHDRAGWKRDRCSSRTSGWMMARRPGAASSCTWTGRRSRASPSLSLWSNLPATIDARQIADLYRRRWHIEGMFQRLESVLQSELRSLGHPRAALLGFAVAVLKRSVEQAHRERLPEGWEASPLPPGGAGQKPLRGDARRVTGRALARLGRRFGQHTGTAPVGIGAAHQAQPGGHEQAWPQGEKDQRVGRWRHSPCSCLHRPPHQGLEKQKTLISNDAQPSRITRRGCGGQHTTATRSRAGSVRRSNRRLKR